MILKKIKIILFVLFIVTPCFAGQYKVLHVVDGDTIDILYQGKKERIRMLNVDTPESVHPDKTRNTYAGKLASDYTKKRLSGQSVDLEFEGNKKRGRYGRLLAYVFIDKMNFNVDLVRQGWSYYYTKYGSSRKYGSTFETAQRAAKAENLGVWKDYSGAYPNEKLNYNVAVASYVKYHGNISNHKFHSSSCRYFNCKKCTKEFKSREEAIDQGYIPCKICKP